MAPNLWNPLPPGYGSKEDEHRLEQCKLFVESSHKVSDRRLSTSTYLLTINSSLLTLMGLLAGLLSDRKPLVLLCAAGVVMSVMWLLLLESFRRLNTAKFDVILQMEERLPANMFKEEWLQLDANRPMSLTEKSVPWTLLVLYLVAAVTLFVWTGPKDEKAMRIQVDTPLRVQTVGPITVVPPPAEAVGSPANVPPPRGRKR